MFKIRSAMIEDLGKLVKCYIEIWESLRKWLPESFVNPEIDRMLKSEGKEWLKQIIRSEQGIVLLAEENDEVIGVALGRIFGGVCHLGFLGVKREYRKRGVGTQLLNRFIDEAKKRKAHKIWLLTSPKLISARRLYIKKGFIPEGLLRKHIRGIDMIIYSKFLTEAEH